MAVFISYSHEDRAFVDRLAENLVLRKTRVWIDRWELKVGDSLISRIQEALQASSALLVIMSEAAVQSEWCKRELSAGLLRELEERRVVVLPVRIDDCTFPIFLREKLYADFRKNFDEGLTAVLEGIASVTAEGLGSVVQPEFHIDWNLDWGYLGDLFCLKFLLAEHVHGQPTTIVTEIEVVADDNATKRYKQYESEGLEWWGRYLILGIIAECLAATQLHVILADHTQRTRDVELRDPKLGLGYRLQIRSRRLGEDSGKDILLDLGGQLIGICKASTARLRNPTADEWVLIRKIMQQA